MSARDCQALLTPSDVVRSMEQGLCLEAAGEVIWSNPPSLRMTDHAGNKVHIKACALKSAGVTGIRLVEHQPDEARGNATRWIILMEQANSLPLAIIDESWNYAQRTVAVMAFASHKLSNFGPHTLALIGAGRLASTAVTYYSHLFDLKEIHVASRTEASRQRLAEFILREKGIQAIPSPSAQEAVRDADLILTCTSGGKQVLADEWVSPGAVVACLDTVEPGLDLVKNSDLLIVDSRELLRDELIEVFGAEGPDWVETTLGEVLAGKHPGRTSKEQRIVVIAQGLVSLDLALARRAYEVAVERGLGAPLPFNSV